MLSLLRKPAPAPTAPGEKLGEAKELFLSGKFPVVTTEAIPTKDIRMVIGLVAFRGYDMEQAFYGMVSRAISHGAHAVIGYKENVAFHPDGSRYVSCYGTAVRINDRPKEQPQLQ